MPLNTEIIRDSTPLQLRWGDFHVAAMVIASALDSGEGPWRDNSVFGILGEGADLANAIRITPATSFGLTMYHILAATPLARSPYTLKQSYRFADTQDGEFLELLPGDQLTAFRSAR